uniref:Methyltransferase domain-containing protein n=1 Tax=Skeletonema marinoi TaxID=267567 RepID=A0A7S2PF97_9STRA|mmetsp:Transcript_19865/g.33596  ORF Transcript_19865/g.33596 Transcript_19865/m.33596 type:complete len:245 (+) Transcript_19865:154-888(+)
MYKYKSDKSRDDHSYVKLYNMIFASIRHSVTNITEIGISHGQSIQAWFRYFPNADIHGFDVKWYGEDVVKINLEHLKPRVHTHIVNILENNITMSGLGFLPESMDIIIDDGPHSVSSQEGFLQKIFPCLKPGGYYIIEDIGIAGNGNGVSLFHDDPSKLQQATRDILEAHDTIWVDTAIGHRAWKEWLKRVGGRWARNTTHHNSYMIVIQKRTDPLREPYQMHYKHSAMNLGGVVLEDVNANAL